MKKLFRTSILLVAGVFTAVSCNDYVEIGPQYAQDADSYFHSPSDYDKALTGAYDLLQTSFQNLWISEIASDNAIAGGESVTDSEGLHQIDEMKHGGVNNDLRRLWRWMYAGVARANFIFENKDKLEFDGKDKVLAQAAFLRGYYYFELVKFFGDVPLVVDKRLGPGEVSGYPRAASSDVYAQIEADLTFAAATLDWTASQKGRITKGAALSLLGKAQLYQGKFNEAAATFETVIGSNQYELFDDIGSLFRVTNETSAETVFDIEYVGTEGGSYGCMECLEGNAAVGFHGIRGYKGPVYGDGNSYNLPTQNLYDAFESDDPRRDAAVLDIEAWQTAHPEVEYTIGGGGHTGYYNNKYLKRLDELGPPDNDLTSPVNYKVIRYADVLLMAAEAQNRKTSPDDSKAQGYLNMVRERADRSDINLTGAALTDAIWNERRLELAGEGHRFFDLVRTGKAAGAIAGFQAGKHELFPIPQVEIDLAGAGWKQNAGY
jgi:hypothetical protein